MPRQTYQLRTQQRNHRITVGMTWRVRGIRGVNEAGSQYGKADCGTFVNAGFVNDDPVRCSKCVETRTDGE
jgi:hypothetical protein